MLKSIQLLAKDFLHFIRKDFHLASYLYTIIVVALSIVIVYTTPIGKHIANNSIPTSFRPLNNILMYTLLYFIILFPTLLLRKQGHMLRQPMLYIKGLLLMAVLGFSDAFSWTQIIAGLDFQPIEKAYMSKVMWRLDNTLFILPVLILMRIFIDKQVKGLYGLCSGNHHVKAYMYLYIVIFPALIFISFTPDFLSYYPIYKPWLFGDVFGHPSWLNTICFELIYTNDFLMVELFFRGMMVIGMCSLLERNAVLPMITIYVALHFGKPVMETISALFGGYVLGALAYQTRHIWGGVIIHMGIAVAIELIRFFQHYVLHVG